MQETQVKDLTEGTEVTMKTMFSEEEKSSVSQAMKKLATKIRTWKLKSVGNRGP